MNAVGRPLRVCFVAPYGYPVLAGDRAVSHVGGAEVQQSYIATELARRGFEVSMISMDFGQGDGQDCRGVRMLAMHAPHGGVPMLRAIHPRLTSLISAMRRADADVYYQRAAGALTGYVAAVAHALRRKFVYAAASDANFDPALPALGNRHGKILFRYGMRHADRIVVQTERQQRMCRDVFGREAVQINSCYGYAGGAADPEGPVLWVGAVRPVKRAALFIELARRVPERRFRLVGGAVGDTAHYESVREQAVGVPNLELTGFVPFVDVEQQFDGGSLLVNTTVHEGFPNTFLQAWSRGMPSVSFFDAGARDDEGRVGRVVADLDEMAAQVRSLGVDRAAWRHEGARARGYVERHHGPAGVGDAYSTLLQELVRQA